jgi:hypothetical protein
MVLRMLSSLALAAPLVLGACDNSRSPSMSEPPRVGADKSAAVTTTLPPAAQQRYDPGIAADNEEKGMKLGAVVGDAGGQQVQIEKDRKARAATEAEQIRQRDELARQQSIDARISTQ